MLAVATEKGVSVYALPSQRLTAHNTLAEGVTVVRSGIMSWSGSKQAPLILLFTSQGTIKGNTITKHFKGKSMFHFEKLSDEVPIIIKIFIAFYKWNLNFYLKNLYLGLFRFWFFQGLFLYLILWLLGPHHFYMKYRNS